jgi:hypothetical protein
MGLFDTLQSDPNENAGESYGGRPPAPRNSWAAPFGTVGHWFIVAIAVAAALVVGMARMVDARPLREGATALYFLMLLVAATALLVGVINVLGVHLRQIAAGRTGWVQSLALVISLFVVFVSGMVSPSGVEGPLARWMFESIIAPGQAALFSLLAFFMAAAAYRFLRIGRGGGAWMVAGAQRRVCSDTIGRRGVVCGCGRHGRRPRCAARQHIGVGLGGPALSRAGALRRKGKG